MRKTRCVSDAQTAVASWLHARMLSRPVPKASDRQRTLARICTDRGRCVRFIDGGGGRAPIVLPLLAPEDIRSRCHRAESCSANRLLLLFRRRQTGNAFAGGRSGDSFLRRRGGRGIVAGGHGCRRLAATGAGVPAAARPLRALRCDPTGASRSTDCRLLSGSAPPVPWE